MVRGFGALGLWGVEAARVRVWLQRLFILSGAIRLLGVVGSGLAQDPSCSATIAALCSCEIIGSRLAVMHRLQHLLHWMGDGWSAGVWGKPNLEAWWHVALIMAIASEATQLATRLHGTGVLVSGSHGHHRTEVARHIALANMIDVGRRKIPADVSFTRLRAAAPPSLDRVWVCRWTVGQAEP